MDATMAEYTRDIKDWGAATVDDFCRLAHYLGKQGLGYGVKLDGKIKRWYAV